MGGEGSGRKPDMAKRVIEQFGHLNYPIAKASGSDISLPDYSGISAHKKTTDAFDSRFVNVTGDTMTNTLTINKTDTGGVVDNNLVIQRNGVEAIVVGEYLNTYLGIRLPQTNLFPLFFGTANDTATDFDCYFIAGSTEMVLQAPTTMTFQIGVGVTKMTLTATNFQVTTDIELDGALNHDGSTVGFYGVTPVTRPTAYTQTYSTTSRTHANITAATLTDSTGGTASNTINPIDDAGETVNRKTIDDNFASILEEINALRTDIANVKNVLNSVIDDLQGNGLCQ